MKEILGGKKVLVLGIGATGKAVIEAANAVDAEVFYYVDNPQVSNGLKAFSVSADALRYAEIDICVASPGFAPTHPVITGLQARGIPVISEVELAYLVTDAPIIAVTGTNGKSTTTVLTGRMMEASGYRTFIGGNISAEGYDLPLITAALQSQPGDVIVAEISSFQLELSYKFRPRSAAFLNISQDHGDRYPNIESYAAAKMRIFQAQEPVDYAVLGYDDLIVRRLGETVVARKLWFSVTTEIKQGAFLRGEDLVLRFENDEWVFAQVGKMGLWASYDRLNVLAAACLARSLDATLDGIRSASKAFTGLPHRMEDCGEVNGVKFFNNSMCTNPVAGWNSVNAVSEKYPAIIIAGGRDKNCNYKEWGRLVANRLKLLILIGKDSIILENAARDAGAESIIVTHNLQDAVIEAYKHARPGDAVVLAPAMASQDQFANFRDRGAQFRELVSRLRMEAKQPWQSTTEK